MFGIVQGAWDQVKGAVCGAGRVLGGLGNGIVDIFKGDIGKGLSEIGQGVWKGVGEVVHGQTACVKHILGDKILVGGAGLVAGAVAGFCVGGPVGAVVGGGAGLWAGCKLSNLGENVAGAVDNKVQDVFGLNEKPAAKHVVKNAHTKDFGEKNGEVAANPGGMPPQTTAIQAQAAMKQQQEQMMVARMLQSQMAQTEMMKMQVLGGGMPTDMAGMPGNYNMPGRFACY